jgi:hypothetical protein
MRGTWQTTGSGGSGLGVAVIVALVIIGSGALTAIMHALAVLLIAAAVAIPVTAVSIIAMAAQRTRSERPGRPDGPVWVSREPPGMRPRLEVPHKPANEPPGELDAPEVHRHLHLHGLAPEQIAEIITRRDGWTPP